MGNHHRPFALVRRPEMEPANNGNAAIERRAIAGTPTTAITALCEGFGEKSCHLRRTLIKQYP
jgi:hypothetical protein